jgi:hypothetical protein
MIELMGSIDCVQPERLQIKRMGITLKSRLSFIIYTDLLINALAKIDVESITTLCSIIVSWMASGISEHPRTIASAP